MESAEEGPSLGPEEVEMVVDQFEARIARLRQEAQELAEEQRGAAEADAREKFCHSYRNGQIRLLQLAIAEMTSMFEAEEEETGSNEQDT